MKFGDDDNVNSSVEDRRGWTPVHYGAGAGGLGLVGVVVVLLVRALGGDVVIDDGSGATGTSTTTSGNAAENTSGATPTAGESCKGASSLADQAKFVACV